jgi:hypothetical protein
MKLFPKNKNHQDRYARRRPAGSPAESPVFSYYTSRSRSSEPTGRGGEVAPRSKRWHYIPSLIAAAAIIVSLGYMLVLDTQPRISLAGDPQTVALRTNETYAAAAQDILGRSWFNRNKLTVDGGSFVRSMKQQFPELQEVAMTLPLLGHRPIVKVLPLQPVLMLNSSTGGLFVVGQDGKAVAARSEANNPALQNLPVVTDQTGLKIETGKGALPADEVTFIAKLTAQLKAQQLTPASLTLPAVANELDVRLEGVPYFIKFNTNSDVREQTGTFLAAKQKLEAMHVTPAEYIDVRVEEKAFYK